MFDELSGIVNPTLMKRIDKAIVEKLINTKVNFGFRAAIKAKKILKFTDELAEELYKPVTRKFQRRRVNVNGIDEIWAADLIDMQALSNDNNGIKYLLTVIDKTSSHALSSTSASATTTPVISFVNCTGCQFAAELFSR